MQKINISGFSDEITADFDGQMSAVKEFGVKYIELRGADGVNVSDFSDSKLKEIKAKLADSGVSISSIGSPIGKILITDDFAPHMEKLKRTLEIQKELNAPYLRMFSFYIPKGEEPEKYRDEVFNRLRLMTEEASRWDSVLLHENEKGIYGDNAARCHEIAEEFYCPNFRTVFDFANFVEVGQDTMKAYGLMKPYIEYIHIKDAVSATKKIVPAGHGDGNVNAILSDLIGGGWRGFLSLEPHLVDFTGLASLELDGEKRNSPMTGKEAWETALNALKAILAEIPQD